MAYNNLVSRTDAQSLIPETVSDVMLRNLQNESAVLNLFRRITMPTNQTRMPVISALPLAYFVNGDTGLKQTTEANWANKYLDVQEIAAIVPIPEAVVEDLSFNIWDEIRPLCEQAIGRTLDAAVFFGTNKPSVWPNDIVTNATAAGNTYTRGTATQAQGGVSADLSNLFAKVEADGYDVNGAIAARTYTGLLRNVRATTGGLLPEVSNKNIYGIDIMYPMRGQWPTTTGTTDLIVGDFTQGIVGIRKDFTWKLLTEGVITDAGGAIVYNLPQQDMVAMRVVMRVAFQVANPLNYDQPTEANRYPFALMLQP